MKDRNNRIEFINNNIVKKHVARFYDISHVIQVQNEVFYNGINCPYIHNYEIINKNLIEYEYHRIPGNNMQFGDIKFIEQILQIIHQLQEIQLNDICNFTFCNKVEFYLTNINRGTLSHNLLQYLDYYEYLTQSYMTDSPCNTIIHGDIDMSNIIINNYTNNPVLIDFDECCLAPKDMDIAIFLSRLLFKLNNISPDIQINQKLISEIKKIPFYLIELYVLKVVSEKIFLTQVGAIDMADYSQQEDSYYKWIKFLETLKNLVS